MLRTEEEIARAVRIAELNDAHRKGRRHTVVTLGIVALPRSSQMKIMLGVAQFNSFNEDNDPYGEHDWGSFVEAGHHINWKIDYLDSNLEYGIDPLDPNCKRVMTIMLAEET